MGTMPERYMRAEPGAESATAEGELNAQEEGERDVDEVEGMHSNGGGRDDSSAPCMEDDAWHEARAAADAEESEAMAEVEAQAARFWAMASNSTNGDHWFHHAKEESQDQQGPVSKEEERSEGVRSVASAAPVATAPAAAPQPQAAPSKREQQQQHQQQLDARGRKAAQYAWVGPQVHEQQAMATAARLHEQTAVIAQKRQEKKVRRMNRPPHQFCLKLLFIHRFLCI